MTSKYGNELDYYFHEKLGYKILADKKQYEYVSSIVAPTNEVQAVFSNSPAGTGKTSLALSSAYYLLDKGLVSKIIYCRNAIPLRDQGFIPGDMEEKEAPYMLPAKDVFNKIQQDLAGRLIAQERLLCTTTSYLRGVDFEGDYILIIDEAQNFDLKELRTILTRPHDSVKVVVIGSSLQNDNLKVKRYGAEGLLPFELFMEHFATNDEVPTKRIDLETNYRGKFSLYADRVDDTVKKFENN